MRKCKIMEENDIQKQYQEILDMISPHLDGNPHKIFSKVGLSDRMFQLLCGHVSRLKFHAAKYEDLGFRDFNKEIFHPSSERDYYPEGVVLIRTDDDFWIEATLPYHPYATMNIKDICESLWPELKTETVKYHEDKVSK